jgi:hypothetical protein
MLAAQQVQVLLLLLLPVTQRLPCCWHCLVCKRHLGGVL